MECVEMKYEFSAKPYQYAASAEMCGWTFVSLPKEMSAAIKNNFKWLEEGWGRIQISTKMENSHLV